MSQKAIAEQIQAQPDHKIFCLHGRKVFSRFDPQEFTRELKKNIQVNPHGEKLKVAFSSSRAQFIRRHRHEGFFFQQRFQASWKDAGKTVGQLFSDVSRKSDLEKLKEEFGMIELWDKPLLQLSSGEWQRFSLCREMLMQPDIIIVPGLLKGLDKDWQYKILDILHSQPAPPQKIIFTTVKPVKHPGVINLVLDLTHTGPETEKPTIPKSLKTKFQNYQGTFLSTPFDAPHIRMSGVTIQYGEKKILQDVHWTVREGDKWNIRGANGAGKSTLLSLVNADNPQGYSQPLELFGEGYGRHSIWERKARIAYFGSDYFQYFRSSGSVADVMQKQLTTPYIESLQPPDSLFRDILDYFNLHDAMHKKFSTLPSGVRREAMLVATYLKSSNILVLDEPFQDMEPDRVSRHLQFIETLQPGSQQSLLFVTHSEEHNPVFLDKVLEVEKGRAYLQS